MAWKKFSLLGAGSYGSVYLAGPLNNSYFTGSLVAVKSANIGSSSSLQREAHLLQQLTDCPYVVQGLGADISREDGRVIYNLLLEYAVGGSLDKLIKTYNGAMAESQIATYTYMLLKGLASIHQKGIVHCDLKPANVLVFPLPEFGGINLLKIADFGLSKKEWEITRRGRGTPMYVSPECVLHGLNEKAGDVWALGCIVVEMFTGRRLWGFAKGLRDLKCQIAYGNPRIPENICEDGQDFLKRCLDRDHNKRWTAEMLLDHPFIVKNLKTLGFGTDHLRCQEVVLRTEPWISSKAMFSTPLKAQPDNTFKAYELFPDDRKRQGCGNAFTLPCGAEVLALFGNQDFNNRPCDYMAAERDFNNRPSDHMAAERIHRLYSRLRLEV